MHRLRIQSLNYIARERMALLLVCLITFFVNNGVLVPDIMESRNIVTAREMVYDGHWLIPTMNGDLRLEKPPLPTWISAFAEAVSPDNLPLQRSMAGLAAVFLVFCFYEFARKILSIPPLIPALLLCTCYNIILAGRTATWDIYCHAFMMGAILLLALALKSDKCKWNYFISSGIFMGLSMMSKGPVSLYALLLPFLIAFSMIYRPKLRGKYVAIIVMIVLALGIGCWWYIYIFLYQAAAMSHVAAKESGSWLNHSVRPWYYYWKFFLETGIWSLLLLTSIFAPWRKRILSHSKKFLFPLSWLLLSLFFLSLLPEKKSRYLLPILLPACYVMSYQINLWIETFKNHSANPADKLLFRINTFTIAFVVVLLPVAAYIFIYKSGYTSLSVVFILALFSGILTFLLCRSAIQLKPLKMLASVTILFLLSECFALPLIKNIVNNSEMKSIGLTRADKRLCGVPFYYNETSPIRIEIVYQAGRKIRPINTSDMKSMLQKMPCALVTHKRVGQELPSQLWKFVDTTYIGVYDNNTRPKHTSFYHTGFIYHVTLLQRKK
jgi:4-amino-4-deoxy-L-arabinose transferase-like glycosyltransferase